MSEYKFGIELISGLTPPENLDFPLVQDKDVLLSNGKRLSEINLKEPNLGYPIQNGTSKLKPDTYYTFGSVDSLELELEELDDGLVHEYCFEFSPTEAFRLLEVSPEVKWVAEPLYVPGKLYQVSIVRQLGIIVTAAD